MLERGFCLSIEKNLTKKLCFFAGYLGGGGGGGTGEFTSNHDRFSLSTECQKQQPQMVHQGDVMNNFPIDP